MIRPEFYVLPKLESAVDKHDKAYGVVVLGMHVGYVCVLDAEPSGSFIENCPNLKFKFSQQTIRPLPPIEARYQIVCPRIGDFCIGINIQNKIFLNFLAPQYRG